MTKGQRNRQNMLAKTAGLVQIGVLFHLCYYNWGEECRSTTTTTTTTTLK